MAVISLACAVLGPVNVQADSKADLNKPYIALGADLNQQERATVLELLDVTEDELKDYTVATVTNGMEHEYLDAYLSASVIGSRALSSVKVIGKKRWLRNQGADKEYFLLYNGNVSECAGDCRDEECRCHSSRSL